MEFHRSVVKSPVVFTKNDGVFGTAFVILSNKSCTKWGLQKV